MYALLCCVDASCLFEHQQDTDSAGQKLGGALLNAIIFMAVIAGMTFVLFLLFKWGVSAQCGGSSSSSSSSCFYSNSGDGSSCCGDGSSSWQWQELAAAVPSVVFERSVMQLHANNQCYSNLVTHLQSVHVCSMSVESAAAGTGNIG
jgi:hypothetical protein